MDLTKPEEWQRQLSVITSAPGPVLALMFAVAIGVWWVAGQRYEGETKGLKAENDAAKQHLALRDAQLKDAQDKAQEQKGAREEAERQLSELKAQVQAQPSQDVATLIARVAALEHAMNRYQVTSIALENSVIHAEVHATEKGDSADIVSATVH